MTRQEPTIAARIIRDSQTTSDTATFSGRFAPLSLDQRVLGYSYAVAVLIHTMFFLWVNLAEAPPPLEKTKQAQQRLLVLLETQTKPVVPTHVSPTSQPHAPTPARSLHTTTSPTTVPGAAQPSDQPVTAAIPPRTPPSFVEMKRPATVERKRPKKSRKQPKHISIPDSAKPEFAMGDHTHDTDGPGTDRATEQTGSPSTEEQPSSPSTAGHGNGAESDSSTRSEAVVVDLKFLLKQYLRRLHQNLNSDLPYPYAASRRRLQGTVVVELTINSEGGVVRHRLAKSSGHEVLDEAALQVAANIHTVMKPPEALQWTEAPVQIPFSYRLTAP